MDTIWHILLWSLVGTLFIFMEILACVLFDMNFMPLLVLVPAALAPLPLVMLRACGAEDDLFGSVPKCLHWAQFTASFLATGLIAIPVLLYTTEKIALGAMLLSLGGFLLLAASVILASYIRLRSEGDGLLQ